MLARLRKTVRNALPPKLVHAYRVVRHTVLWPTEYELAAARQFLSPDGIAVDVGANVGLFTSVLVRHSKKVIAFEPNPDCARQLVAVMPQNCEVIAKAVSDQCGTSILRVPVAGNVDMDALATIDPSNQFATETRAAKVRRLSVETVTLDECLLPTEDDTRVTFINIDAEGHEFAILRGGEGVIHAHRPVLLIELEYRHGAAVNDVFTWLGDRGYVGHALIDTRNLVPIDANMVRSLQDEVRLAKRLSGDRHSGYVNNIFFLPHPV
jgi:FkbM family methyltransferase